MTSWMDQMYDLVLDRSVEEVFGAILLALALAGIGAAACIFLSRRRVDAMARLTGVILVVNLASMVAGGSFVRHQFVDRDTPIYVGDAHAFGPGQHRSHSERLIYFFDTDRDGELSAAEVEGAPEVLEDWARSYGALAEDDREGDYWSPRPVHGPREHRGARAPDEEADPMDADR